MRGRAGAADPAVAAVGFDGAAEAPACSLEEDRERVALLLRQVVRRAAAPSRLEQILEQRHRRCRPYEPPRLIAHVGTD